MDERHVAGAIAGGVGGGFAITAMLITGERMSRQPSGLAKLGRVVANKVGRETPAADALPSATEQLLVQGGHFAFSALAGAPCAATVDKDAPVAGIGIGFGLAFYAVAHWITGPMLGLKHPEWQSDTKTIAMHTMNHIGFGLITALGARTASRYRQEYAQ
jgi:hypothetical protein